MALLRFIHAGERRRVTHATAVTQSSCYDPTNNPPGNLVDGNPNTWTSTRDTDADTWMLIDIGRTVPIHHIKVTNRLDAVGERANGVIFQVLKDDQAVAFTSVPLVASKDGTTAYKEYPNNNAYSTFDIRPPAKAVVGSDSCITDGNWSTPTAAVGKSVKQACGNTGGVQSATCVSAPGNWSFSGCAPTLYLQDVMTAPRGSSYMGCLTDSDSRILPTWLANGDNNMTIERCAKLAQDGGLKYYAVQDGEYCFGGNSNPNAAPPSTACNMLCPGDHTKLCGGPWGNQTYQFIPQDTLHSGHSLGNNQMLTSKNGAFTIKMQSDGNLVSANASGAVTWASGTNGKGQAPYKLALHEDGTLVMHDAKKSVVWTSAPASKSKTAKRVGMASTTRSDESKAKSKGKTTFVMQNDGQAVVFDATKKAVWKTQ
jgi:hypothetical protein